jgi:translation initiation factor 2B subunit (eIF-2B alpha/beta/delta family)
MARQAVETLAEMAAEQEVATCEEALDALRDAGRRLAAARPGVGAIAGAVGRLLASGRYESHLDPEILRRVLEEEALALTEGRIRAPASIAIQLRERLEGATVMPHSASATVREAIAHTPPAKVICTVSRPVEEGRAFAEDLRQEGLEVELVEDSEAPERISETSLFLIGADTVFSDGAVCNKVGTIPIARAAAADGIDIVVAAEVVKLAPVVGAQAPDLADFERELFEMIPGDLVTEFVTEEGVFRPDALGTLVDRVPFLREGYELVAPAGVSR